MAQHSLIIHGDGRFVHCKFCGGAAVAVSGGKTGVWGCGIILNGMERAACNNARLKIRWKVWRVAQPEYRRTGRKCEIRRIVTQDCKVWPQSAAQDCSTATRRAIIGLVLPAHAGSPAGGPPIKRAARAQWGRCGRDNGPERMDDEWIRRWQNGCRRRRRAYAWA